METIEQKLSRIIRVPSLINWARQNFQRTDKTRDSLKAIADSKILISLHAVYLLCAKLAYKEVSYEEAWDTAMSYKGFPGRAAQEIIPIFNEYITRGQIDALPEFRDFRIPFPIGKNPLDIKKTLAIPVKPTFISIQEGKLRPVFLVGWVDSPLNYHQRRLISAIIRRAILTQQDFIGSDADIVTFARKKYTRSERELGVWRVSQFPDYSDEELVDQFARYSRALQMVIDYLKDSAN